MHLLIMGVAGSGKTTVGRAVADRLGWPFLDADDFHSPDAVAKMARGEPLTDADRAPWLVRLHTVLVGADARGEPLVLACSALTRVHRAVLAGDLRVRIIYLTVTPEVARTRLAARRGHYMPPSLVDSQFRTLEPPSAQEALVLDARRPGEVLVQQVIADADTWR